MADDKNNPGRQHNGSPSSDGPAGRQPMRMLLFWLVVLFACPTLILLYRASHDQDIEPLPWYEFEDLLTSDRVQDATVVEDPSSGYMIKVVRGSYWPANVEIENVADF